MIKRFSRFLVAFSGLLLTLGGLMHAAAFNKILSALSASDLQSFAANSLKVLWLADTATCLILAGVLGFIAARPSAATRWVIVLLALIPAATAALIYTFIGGHILLAATVAALIGGLQYPGSNLSGRG